ncbi:hypothetical protein GCM10010245_78990 [Streptomyces spectabilis]|uniref:Uncharacterized protein n=1 Tax=Streptomyces spectabilis TaxID=68270 RepID=A0A7W8ANN8_STRST|nr:hypothetical protein [Streptomyces spectabilis]GGV50105.1 hypothetical protein GCM10010245_78990 [Streptomyces spectabilis]
MHSKRTTPGGDTARLTGRAVAGPQEPGDDEDWHAVPQRSGPRGLGSRPPQ